MFLLGIYPAVLNLCPVLGSWDYFQFFAITRDACLMHGWVLDGFLMLPRLSPCVILVPLNWISQSSTRSLKMQTSTPMWCPRIWHQDMVTTCCSFTHVNCWDWAWAGSPPCLVSQLCPSAQRKVPWPDEWPGLNPEFGVWCTTKTGVPCYVYAWFL